MVMVQVVEEDKIKQVVVDFYKNLLGVDSSVFSNDKAARVSQLLQTKISYAQCHAMQREFSEELKPALFSMHNNKAPELDEFPADFEAAIKDFFSCMVGF